jgi:hypothetical protein
MKKTAFILSMLFSLFLFSAGESFACSCLVSLKPQNIQVKESFDNSAAIFSGEILDITPQGEWELKVKIKVEKSWKPKLSNEITLTTALK